MEKYWDAVGATDTYSTLSEFAFNKTVTLLEGYSGTGKSWMLKTLCIHWEKSGGSCFYFEGRPTSYLSPYSILHEGIESFNSINIFRKSLPKLLGMSIDSLFKTRGVFAHLFSFAGKLAKSRISDFCPAYDLDSASIFESIDVKSNNKPILLIADNIQYWDLQSLALLIKIIEKAPEATEVSVVVSLTKDQETPDTERQKVINEILKLIEEKLFLPMIDETNYHLAYRELGLRKDTPTETFTSIFTICGSNIPSITKAITAINSQKKHAEFQTLEDIYKGLINEKSGDNNNRQLEDALKYAAVIGNTFLKSEIKCVFGDDKNELNGGLVFAQKLGFIEYHNERYTFLHEAFQKYFKALALKSNYIQIYEKLDSCFSILKPSEYMTRAIIAYECSNYKRASCFLLIHISEECRKYGKRDLKDFQALFKPSSVFKKNQKLKYSTQNLLKHPEQ